MIKALQDGGRMSEEPLDDIELSRKGLRSIDGFCGSPQRAQVRIPAPAFIRALRHETLNQPAGLDERTSQSRALALVIRQAGLITANARSQLGDVVGKATLKAVLKRDAGDGVCEKGQRLNGNRWLRRLAPPLSVGLLDEGANRLIGNTLPLRCAG